MVVPARSHRSRRGRGRASGSSPTGSSALIRVKMENIETSRGSLACSAPSIRSRTRCCEAGRLTQTPSTMMNAGAELPPTPAFRPQTASGAAYRLDYAHDSVGHDSVKNCPAEHDRVRNCWFSGHAEPPVSGPGRWPGSPTGLSARPIQGQVTDGHHTHRDAVGDDRQAAHRTIAHQPRGVLDVVFRAEHGQLTGVYVAQARRGRVAVLGQDPDRDVALGDHPFEPPAGHHEHGADPPLLHGLGRGRDRFGRRHAHRCGRHDVPYFPGHDSSGGARSPSDTIPATCPSSITGSLRTACSRISATATAASSSARTPTRSRLLSGPTGSSGPFDSATALTTRSRSVTRPYRAWSLTTRTAPPPQSRMVRAAVPIDWW